MPKKKSARKRLYDLHTWVGFHLAVIMMIVLATGTFATISNELDWLSNSAQRVAPDGTKVSWQEMYDAVQAEYPNASIQGIAGNLESYFAHRAMVFKEDGTFHYALVDQWTGEVTGTSSFFTFQYFFRNFHRYLFLPKIVGLTLVCSMAIILTISLYTGLKTSRNWRTLMTRIRFSKGARIAVGDAHKFAGLWSLWFFVLMILTGLWYYAEYLSPDFEPTRSILADGRAAEFGEAYTPPKMDYIIAAAQKAYPELQISAVSLPVNQKTPILVDGSVGNPIVRPRANRIYIDPITLEIIRIQKDKDLSTVQWINQIVDPLHFGNFGGLVVKLIWFIFGIFMTGLSASGVWLTWKRLKSTGATRLQILSFPILAVSIFLGIGNYVGLNLPGGSTVVSLQNIWFVLAIFLGAIAIYLALKLRTQLRSSVFSPIRTGIVAVGLLASTSGFVHGALIQDIFKPDGEKSLGQAGEDPIEAELFAVLKENGSMSGTLHLAASGKEPGQRLNVKSVSLQLEDHNGAIGEPLARPTRNLMVVQNVHFGANISDVRKATKAKVTFEFHTGKIVELHWPIAAEFAVAKRAAGFSE